MNTAFNLKGAKAHCLSIILAVLLLACCFLPTAAAYSKEPNKPIRVGWFIISGFQEINNGVYSGYNYEYLMEIAKYTGWTYEFVVEDPATCLKMLAAGEIDLLGGCAYNAERAQLYDYANIENGQAYATLFTSQSSSLQQYDFEAFSGIKVGIVRNSAGMQEALKSYAAENGFICRQIDYPNYKDLYAAVKAGSVDAGVMGSYTPSDETRVLAEFAPKQYYFITTKGNRKLLVELNRAINQIKIDNPYLEITLHKKYYAAPSLKLTDAELAIVKASQKTPITVGVFSSSAPLFYLDANTGEYVGLAIDTLRLVSKKTGLKFDYVAAGMAQKVYSTHHIEEPPKLVVGVTCMYCLTDSRGWYLSNALVNDTLVLVGKSGSNITNNPSEKTLALVHGFAVAEKYVAACMPEYKVEKYENSEACLNAVVEGKADAAVCIRSCASYLLQKPYFENLEIISVYSYNIDITAASLTKENSAFIGIINKGLSRITDEESRSITLNYTVMNPYQLTMSDTLYKYRTPVIIILVMFAAVIAALSMLYWFRRKSSMSLQKAYEKEKEALAAAEQASVIAEQASAAKGSFMSRMSH